jgi:hypothetical protein
MTYKELQAQLRIFRDEYLTDVKLNSSREILQAEYNRVIEQKEINDLMIELEGLTTEEVLGIVDGIEKNIKTYEKINQELIKTEQKKAEEEMIAYFKNDEHILPEAIPALLGHKTILRLDCARLNVQTRLDWILEDIAYQKDEIYTSFYDKEISILNYCLSK